MIMTEAARQTQIAIVGGGPVGLLLALFLDRHGIRSTVFNTESTTRWHPKGSTHNSRTMEHYRRLGLSCAVRELGLPREHPRDVAYFTRYNAWELARIALPSEAQSAHTVGADPQTAQVPEPLLRANQMYVERYLFEAARTRPNITLRFGWVVTDFLQNARRVTLEAERETGDAAEGWEAAFLVGCDGGHSFVRRKLGVRYQGDTSIEQPFLGGRMISTYVRIPALHRDILGQRKAWMYNVIATDLRMLLISLDGGDEFLLMSKAHQQDGFPTEEETARTIQRGTGADVSVSVLGQGAWNGGVALVAERFRDRRVFLAGDATHLFSPTGGFGMNTGIDGAANLAWKLAAAVQGWAGDALLESYESERRAVARRNTAAAQALTRRAGELTIPAELEQPTSLGQAARQELGRKLEQLRPQFTSLGVELGARYDDSALIWSETVTPRDEHVEYRPSAVPGGRLPHLWWGSGRGPGDSLFDRLGLGFTLLRVGDDAPAESAFARAARQRGVPFTTLTLPREPAWSLYERKLVLVRPDQHIAWRGDRLPRSPGELLDRCRGVEASVASEHRVES